MRRPKRQGILLIAAFTVQGCGLLGLISSLRSVSALDTSTPITRYVRDTWQTDNGLPQNFVLAIAQTRNGYLWLGTQEGLVRFDGQRFTVFDKQNTPQLRDNSIQALYEDAGGVLWIGTGGGLSRFSAGRFATLTTEDGLSNDNVDTICGDSRGNIWIGTPAGLNRYKDGVFKSFTVADGLLNNVVLSILPGRDDMLWVGTRGGLHQVRNDTITAALPPGSLASDFVRALFEDGAGDLWIGTSSGLNRVKEGRINAYTTQDGLPDNSVLTIYEDRNGSLWVGTAGGLARLEGSRFSAYTSAEGLSNDSVGAILEDSESNLWVGTYGGGLNRLKDGTFSTLTAGDGLSSEMIWTTLEDRHGNQWIGTRNGLNRYRNGLITAYTTRNGLANNNVLSLHEDRRGSLWIGTAGGLSQMTRERFKNYTTREGLADDNAVAILEDSQESVWVGTGGGLSRIRNGGVTTYTTRDGLSEDVVLSLSEAPDGALWIGTDGGGLNRWKDEKITVFTTADGLSNNVVFSLYHDPDGSLWIGTNNGLNLYRDGRFTRFTSRNGLFDDVVFQVLEDENRNLWMSCNKGVFRVSKRELDEFAAGTMKSINSTSYGTADGMKSRECNGGSQPAGWRSRDGRLWFPTIKGLAVDDPRKIKANLVGPPVIIEAAIVDGSPIEITGDVLLPPGKEKFEFHYTGLSFTAPEKIRFRYKLEGFDRDWAEAGPRREVAYTNLPPGNYTLRVIARGGDGVWNQTGATLSFRLKPFFYQTFWFYASCAAAIGLVGWGLHRYRLKHVEARFAAVLAERNRISRDIHDTLAQGFVAISARLETVARLFSSSPGAALEHLDQARILVRSSLAEARRSVLDLRPQALESGDLVEAISKTVDQLSTETAISVRVTGTPRPLDPQIEANLLRIGQEALANAVRHAGATAITVEIHFAIGEVRLVVRDDGRGFDVNAQFAAGGSHLGLIGMRERVEQSGGRLSLESKPDSGTTINVAMPAD
jgi:ligand-binding sensor domain-containing protein/signal transduction histidine kinase